MGELPSGGNRRELQEVALVATKRPSHFIVVGQKSENGMHTVRWEALSCTRSVTR